MDFSYFEKIYRETSNFDHHLGMELSVHEAGRVTYRLIVQEHHLSSPGACHGGVISAMMDSVLGVTALSWVIPHGKLCATVEFKINYLSPVGAGDTLEGTGELEFTGSKLVVTTGRIQDMTNGHAVARGMGTFTSYPISKKAHLSALLSQQRAT